MIKKNIITKFINNHKKSYKILKLKINNNIKKLLEQFNINNFSCFNHYDENKLLDLEKLKLFIKNIGNNSDKSINLLSKFIKNLLNNVCKEYNKKYSWLTIRISKANDNFNIPRWHYDGYFYKNEVDKIQTKFLLTLKGPSTLVINPSEKIKNKFMKIKDNSKKWNDKEFIKTRLKRNKIVKNEKIKKIKSLINGLISISKITIHSEPPIKKDRIFLSILPMTKEECEFMKTSGFFN